MKKCPAKVTAIVCLFFMLAACSKEVDVKTSSNDVQNIQSNKRFDRFNGRYSFVYVTRTI